MPRTDLRASGDLNLAKILLEAEPIKKVIERHTSHARQQTRRMLLGSAVRITGGMASSLVALLESCRETLEMELPVELYVSPDPRMNAFCYGAERGRVLIVLTSALLESMGEPELRFVIGHELGHHIFGHLDIPVGLLAHPEVGLGKREALRLFAWQRYAEISADRAGLVCTGELEPVAHAFFKIASGLRGDLIELDVDDYLAQIGDIQAEAAQSDREGAIASLQADWFASHPFSPLRVRVAQLTAGSTLLDPKGISIEELETRTDELLSVMDPGYLHDKSETGEAMRRLLFTAGLLVAAAHAGISDNERDSLEKLLGPGSLPQEPDVEALEASLDDRVKGVLDAVPPLKRARLIQDLAVIASADHPVQDPEVEVLRDVADRLGVDHCVIDRTLHSLEIGLD